MNRKSLLCGTLLLLPFAVGVAGATSQRAFANPIVTPATTLTMRQVPIPIPRPTVTAIALPTLIAFDNVPSGTVVDSTYGPAALFSVVTGGPNGAPVPVPGAHVYASVDASIVIAPCTFPSCPSPGGNLVTLNPPGKIPWFEGADGGIKVTFNAPKAWVSVSVRASGLPGVMGTLTNEPYLIAYGANGYLGEVLYPLASTDPNFGTFQKITFPPSGPAQAITSVILSTQQRSGPHVAAEFDNLSFPQ
ncbi:MAG TPA: hypothetical protein VII82_09950 [Polyangiaceae bacterium]|jgi:hypothetical protein